MGLDGIEVFVIVIDRKEIESQRPSTTLQALNRLLESPAKARAFRERVDIAFHGYDADPRELWEISGVRNFVFALDDQFPFWLFFLSKRHLGLQCLLLCSLPPFLTKSAQARTFPERIDDLMVRRWVPALNHICSYVDMSGEDVQEILDRTGDYVAKSPLNKRMPGFA